MMAAAHDPVLLPETIDLLAPARGGVFVDCTVGLGGHSRALLESGATKLIGLDRVNYFGQAAEIDSQGRVLIHQRLRESAGMAGEVDVLGSVDRLDVWNHDRLVAKMLSDPYTDDDARALSEFGI